MACGLTTPIAIIRSAILRALRSGRRPETTRIWDNNTPPRTHLGDVVFLPEYFKAQGYFTARVGKIAHGLFEQAVSWDISESTAGVPLGAKNGNPSEDHTRAGQGLTNTGGLKLTWEKTANRDEQEPDGATARRIVQLI